MKFLMFLAMDVAKAAEVAQASDKVWASPPAGTKLLATYACLGIPWSGVTGNMVISVGVVEAENAEALTGVIYPMGLAGASAWCVPVLELPVGRAAAVERQVRG